MAARPTPAKMDTHLSNRQKAFRPDAARLTALLSWLAARSVRAHKCAPIGELTLVLMDDKGIREVHRRCFNADTTTDVISLNYDALPGDTAGTSGEIFVNLECAARNARPPKPGSVTSGLYWDASRELALYMAHGCDHLGGGEDDTDMARRRMRNRELRWLRMATREGLLDEPLFEPRN